MSDSAPVLFGWERTALAVEKVKDRLKRASAALQQAGIEYAVIGGNAVAEWVGRVDEAAVRNTRDVDILIRRTDLDAVRTALESVGFIYRNVQGLDIFLDGASGRAVDAVNIVSSGEKVRSDHVIEAPDVDDSEPAGQFHVVSLNALVRMKLTSNRDKDRTHLRDIIGVGMIDQNWLGRFPPVLAARLQSILDTPDG